MNKFTLTALSLALSFSLTSYAEDHHGKDKTFTSQQVSDQITLLQGRGGNIAVLKGDQGLLMVDDEYQDMSPALQTALSPFGGENKLTYIINTHFHFDHTEGNHHFGHHAQIVAHDNVRERLLTSQEIKLFGVKTEPYPKHALPSITYKEQMKLHINEEEVSLRHLPGGHTDGDSVVLFKNANVVHTGDLFFNGFYPFVDVQNGGSVSQMAKNAGVILSWVNDDTKIIPGHGPLAKKADLVAFKAMLEGTEAEVKALKDKGMSLEDIQKTGLSDKWKSWANGFLKEPVWISIVYSSLEKE